MRWRTTYCVRSGCVQRGSRPRWRKWREGPRSEGRGVRRDPSPRSKAGRSARGAGSSPREGTSARKASESCEWSDRPSRAITGIPSQTLSEGHVRDYVKKRKISGSTRSELGRRARDSFASLKKTCRRLGVNFWADLQDRVRGLGQILPLATLIRQKGEELRPCNA